MEARINPSLYLTLSLQEAVVIRQILEEAIEAISQGYGDYEGEAQILNEPVTDSIYILEDLRDRIPVIPPGTTRGIVCVDIPCHVASYGYGAMNGVVYQTHYGTSEPDEILCNDERRPIVARFVALFERHHDTSLSWDEYPEAFWVDEGP